MGRQDVVGAGMMFLGWGWFEYAARESMYHAGVLFMIFGLFILLDGIALSRILVLAWVRLGALIVTMGLLRNWKQWPLSGKGPYDYMSEMLLYSVGAVFIIVGLLYYWFTHDLTIDDLLFQVKRRLTLDEGYNEFKRSLGTALGIGFMLLALFISSVYFEWSFQSSPEGNERLSLLFMLFALIFLINAASSLSESIKSKSLPFGSIGGFLFLWGFSFLTLPNGDLLRSIVLIIAALSLYRFSDGLDYILYEDEKDLKEISSVLPKKFSNRTESYLKIALIVAGLILVLYGILITSRSEIISSMYQNIVLLILVIGGIMVHLYIRSQNFSLQHPIVSAITLLMMGGILYYGIWGVVELIDVISGTSGVDPRGLALLGLGLFVAKILIIGSGVLILNYSHRVCSISEKSTILGIPFILLGVLDLIYSPINLVSDPVPNVFHTLTVSGGLLGGNNLLEGISLILVGVVVIGYPQLKSIISNPDLQKLVLLLPFLIYGLSLVVTFNLPNAYETARYVTWWETGLQVIMIAGVLFIIYFAINTILYYLKEQRELEVTNIETTA